MLKKIVYLTILLPVIAFAQHKIKGTFSPAKDFKHAILYKITPEAPTYVAFSEIDDEGKFEIPLDSTAKKGMYKIVYAMPPEQFNFDVIYNGKEDIALEFNTETGVKFISSIENTLVNSYSNSMGMITQSIGNFFRQQSTDSLALENIFKTQRETQAEYEKAAENTIAFNFIKASRSYIPESFEDISTYIGNLKTHFFDHVDFNNEVLQSSNFLVERMLNYVFGMATANEEGELLYTENIDAIVAAMKDANPDIKSNLLEVLWQQMVDANQEAVANYISDNYLLDLAKANKDEQLTRGLELFKSLSVGNKAPEFDVEVLTNGEKKAISLYDLDIASQYIVVFWGSTCGHCLNEMPNLKTYLQNKPEVKVIAIGLEDDDATWKPEIKNYPEFIHVLGLEKWNNPIGKSYNVTSTPTYFVLNVEKKIVAKPYDFEALKKWMETK